MRKCSFNHIVVPDFVGNDNLDDIYIEKIIDHASKFDFCLVEGIKNKVFGSSAREVDPIKEGTSRQGIHPDGTRRFFNDKNTEDIIGLFGEKCFAEEFGYCVDLALRKEGDGHIDFMPYSPIKKRKISIDVKTARKPFNILVKEWEIKSVSDIVVLAKFSGNNDYSHANVEMLGWEYGEEIKKCPIKDFGYGIRNYYKSANKLRKMSELKTIMGVKRKPLDNIDLVGNFIAGLRKKSLNRIWEHENKNMILVNKSDFGS